jgi:hypothetical protein|tara:strand:+ start:898 stop:2052 length:1155 start_codon:yes stop_codon:yes gene_type:complete
MNIFDKFFTKFAYKFDKGYPDMDNNQDVLLLESLINEVVDGEFSLKEEVPNMAGTKKAVALISQELGNEYGIRPLPSKPNRLSAPGIKDSSIFLDIIKKTFGPETDITVLGPRQGQNPSGKFPMFQFDTEEFGQVNMLASFSAPGGAGKTNEAVFIETLNNLITQAGEEAKIVIKSPEYTETFNNVTQVEDSSKTGAGKGDKSDAQFLSNSDVVANISLKQDGGFRWASVASNFPDFIKTFQEKAFAGQIDGFKLIPNPDVKGKYLMANSNTGERVTKVVIPDFIEEEDQISSFVFGPENPKVIVVSRTWKEDDFKLEGDTITVQASHIYKDLDDIEKGGISPVFTIAQHQNKPIGLDYRIYPANMAKIGPRAKGIELSINDII